MKPQLLRCCENESAKERTHHAARPAKDAAGAGQWFELLCGENEGTNEDKAVRLKNWEWICELVLILLSLIVSSNQDLECVCESSHLRRSPFAVLFVVAVAVDAVVAVMSGA